MMNSKAVLHAILIWLASNMSQAVEFSFLERGLGYDLEPVEIEHSFESLKLLVLRDKSIGPLELKGLLSDNEFRVELTVIFSDGKPISYSYKKWKKITHPDLSVEGETSETLVIAQAGYYKNLEREVKDERLKKIFEDAIIQLDMHVKETDK